jgi:DNA-binding NarL/FixJ family response regulator
MIANVRCPRLVGRAAESERLNALLAKAEQGRGSLVFISGDPGIGKTRLISDFLYLAERKRHPRAVGYCMEHARSPLAPLSDIIWSISDEQPSLLKQAASTRRVLVKLVPSLAQPGDDDSGTMDPRAQYAAIADLIRRASEKRAAIVVIEDAQWADFSTIDFLTFIAARLAGLRALIVVNHREVRVGHDPLAESIARVRANVDVHAMSLAPLAHVDMRKLSRLALATGEPLPDDVLRRVYELADGNPLFAEELLGTARSSAGGAVPLPLPASLRTLFLDRFGGLDPDDREMLTQAAVIGRSFDPVFLAQLTGRPIDEILRALRNARELQLVDDEGDGIVFRHALVRETLYGSLLAAEARRLHRKMAEELGALPPTAARISALAYHWWSAHDSSKAFAANVLAGERAMGALATSDAAQYFERALACLPGDDPGRAEIEEKLGAANSAGGFPEKAEAAYMRALAVYQVVANVRKIAAVSLELERQSAAQGNGDVALEWGMKAIAATDKLDNDPGFRFTAYAHLAWSMVVRGDVTKAREFLRRADGLQSDAPFAARLDFAEATIFADYLSGAVEQSEATFATLCADLERDGVETTLVARAYHNNAFLHGIFGDLSTAVARATHAVAVSDETLAPAYHLASLGILSALLVKRGELERAAELLADAERIIANLGQNPTRFTSALASAAIPLGAHTAQPALSERYGDPAELEEAFASREFFWSSTTALAFVYDAAARNDERRARQILDRLIDAHSPAPMIPELAIFAAQFASSDRTARLIAMMDAWPDITPALRAARALADGFLQRRAGRSPIALAKDAAQRFERFGQPLLAALAHELAGDTTSALRLYENHGYTADVARLDAGNTRGAPRSKDLSPREREVLAYVLRGRTNAEIAAALNISERTVESHVRAVLAKYGVKSRLQLVSSENRDEGRSD